MRLLDFLSTLPHVDLGVVKTLMLIDYFKPQSFIPRKTWWKERVAEDQLKALYTAIRQDATVAGEEFASMNVSEKDLFKHSLIIPSSISYKDLQEGRVVKQDGCLFIYFRQGQAPYMVDIKL